jgi:hypothetical protein
MLRGLVLTMALCLSVPLVAQAGPREVKPTKPRPAEPKRRKPTPAPAPAPADDDKPVLTTPPLAGWSGVWHTAATVQYSSCPGTVPGHQEAFTLTVVADDKAITATEQPEQSLLRKFTGAAEQRGKRWILVLRDKEGKNGMDLLLQDDGRKLGGTRVIVRQVKKALCSVVYDVEATRDDA